MVADEGSREALWGLWQLPRAPEAFSSCQRHQGAREPLWGFWQLPKAPGDLSGACGSCQRLPTSSLEPWAAAKGPERFCGMHPAGAKGSGDAPWCLWQLPTAPEKLPGGCQRPQRGFLEALEAKSPREPPWSIWQAPKAPGRFFGSCQRPQGASLGSLAAAKGPREAAQKCSKNCGRKHVLRSSGLSP